MDDSLRGGRVDAGGSEDSRIYGVGWLGLLAALAGALVGVVMLLSEGESALVAAATISVSVSLAVLIYLVSKVLDRH